MDAPNSYRDPFWSGLASATEQKLGLPSGLLVAVLTKGERSNADQVSSAGARTPFQITPATRVAVAKKHGVDAYLSPQNAAEVAGLILRDSLKRNGGDISQAVGEYIGGTDRSNWGKTTRAYIERVMQGVPQAEVPDPTAGVEMPVDPGAGAPSTFDRIWAQLAPKPSEGSIAKVAEAYKAGKMTPDEAKQFEADVQAGRIMLPRGVELKPQTGGQAPQLPAGVLAAYQAGKMQPTEAQQLAQDIRAGMWSLPGNVQLDADGRISARIPEATQVQPLPKPDAGIVDKAIGAGEAALSTLTGATGGALGMAGGTVKGLADAVANGTYGTKAGADAVEQAAVQGAQALTYAPRTEQGQEYAQAVGDAMQQAMPVIGAAPGLPAMTVRPAGNPAALARASAEGTARDVTNLVARPAEALGVVAPGAAGEAAAQAAGAGVQAAQNAAQRVAGLAKGATTLPRRALEALRSDEAKPTPGTMPSAGSAGADMASQRVATAESLPVPLRLTKGEATRDPAQVKFEEGAAKNMEQGGALRERIAEHNARLLQNFDQAVDQTGAQAPSLRVTGQVVDEALRKQYAADKAKVRAAYKAAESAGEMEAPVLLDSVIQHLNDSAPDAATAPLLDVARARAIRLGLAAEDASGNLVAQPAPLKLVETFRQAINRATDFEPTNIRQATIIKGLVDEATDGMGGGLYRRARAERARLAQNYEDHAVISKLLNLKRGTTDRQVALEDVFQHSILKGSTDGVRQVRRVLQRGGEEGAQAWRELQGATAGWLRDQAATTSTDAAGTRVISAAKLDKAIRELDADGKLDFVFGRKGAQTMRDLRDVAQWVKTAPPEAAINYANSAWTMLGAFVDAGSMGMTGVPAPLATISRLGFKYVKDAKLRRRIEDALRDAERQHAPGKNNPPKQAPNAGQTLH